LRRVVHVPTSRVVGIEMRLKVYCMDSDGQAVPNPRFIHHVGQRVRRRSWCLSRRSLHHQQGKKPKHNHAARQWAKHNRYPPATARAPRFPQQPHHPVPTPPAAAAPPPAPVLPGPSTPRRHQSANGQKARQALAKTSLTLQRQRKDFARTQASALVSSHDVIALEDLQIRNLVKNLRLAKAISDVSWARFRS